jgi:hypothetical protein
MTRRLLNLLTALSLLLCVAVCVVWVRSYGVWDMVEWFWPTGEVTESGWSRRRGIEMTSAHGWVCLSYVRDSESKYVPDVLEHSIATSVNGDDFEALQWFDGSIARRVVPGLWGAHEPLYTQVVIQDGWLFVATAVLPAAWLLRSRSRRRRLAAGRCVSCGYNLTGNVSGVCPECGKCSNATV